MLPRKVWRNCSLSILRVKSRGSFDQIVKERLSLVNSPTIRPLVRRDGEGVSVGENVFDLVFLGLMMGMVFEVKGTELKSRVGISRPALPSVKSEPANFNAADG